MGGGVIKGFNASERLPIAVARFDKCFTRGKFASI